MAHRRSSIASLLVVASLATGATGGVEGDDVAAAPLLTAPVRESEPVVLTGAQFPTWAAAPDVAVAAPSLEGLQCLGEQEGIDTPLPDSPMTAEDPCSHNEYDEPLVSSQTIVGQEGVPVDRLVAYRWDGESFDQIPFQVDEMFPRFLSNDASGFAVFSERDRHVSYAFDREGFRWTASDPDDPCLAAPASPVASDPVPGLDADDELVFMARDAGPKAPTTAGLPDGTIDVMEVTVVDPNNQATGYVYVAQAADGGPTAAFDATNGYVRYERDADADVFLFSQSSYSDYGNAPDGPWFDPSTGRCEDDPTKWRQHRPGDQATITTPRYRYRYEGRWLMTELQVSAHPTGDWTYGADLVDQWKARAFQQRPGGETPCCGYEEEVNNWGGSSILMGERVGPVRAIRETWGADSGTNVVRRETFYRDEIRLASFLRVHVIPPLDGIYVQWDHEPVAIDTYYNPYVTDGVPVDGRNDETFGNSEIALTETGVRYDGDDDFTDMLGELTGGTPIVVGDPDSGCEFECVRNDIDTPDPTFSGPNALLAWEQLDGPAGTLVTRWSSRDVTPGGAAHALVAAPYYRDDACFDDGTGSTPGPHVNGRNADEGATATWTDSAGNTLDRECWDVARHLEDPVYAEDLGSRRFFQGSIGTHGLHLLFIADSDNLFLPVPVTELNAEQRMVVLPPQGSNVGEAYGRGFETPLVALVAPAVLTGEPGEDEPAPTALTIDAPTDGQHTDSVDVAVLLQDEGGVPVSDAPVQVTLGSGSTTVTTGGDGRAMATVPLADAPGATEVVAIFPGDEERASSEARAPFTILHEATSLTYNGDTATGPQGPKLSARLVEDDGPAVVGAVVRFAIDGQVVDAITDDDGIATVRVDTSNGRDHEVVVTFAGTDTHAGSEDRATVRWDPRFRAVWV